MDVLALGCRYPDGGPLFGEVNPDELIGRLVGVTGDARRVAAAPWTFDEIRPKQQPRPDVPEEAGWTYVVGDMDLDRDGIIAALEPLAAKRGMKNPSEPLRFESDADRGNWIDHVYKGLGDRRPRYLLLAGDPAVLPFSLQVDLAAAGAMVGRLGFTGDDRMDAYKTYALKVERFDSGNPVPKMAATVISTFGGPLDATIYSSKFLSPPIAALMQKENFNVRQVTAKAATKAGVRTALGAEQPALVFTATHGAGYVGGDAGTAEPRAVNGAWGCAPADESAALNAWDWLTAADLPVGNVAPGGLVFQFACFGYGTTNQSSFAAWLGNPNVIVAPDPLVAAIPQRLLADPDGPIGYIGHVDIALAHGFIDPYDSVFRGRPHPRVQPFLSLIKKAVVELTPLGFALRDLQERASSLASELVTTFDGLEQQGILIANLESAAKASLIDKVIRRNDAMHFLLFGDPAARVRIDA
jgi:hypothetical protein